MNGPSRCAARMERLFALAGLPYLSSTGSKELFLASCKWSSTRSWLHSRMFAKHQMAVFLRGGGVWAGFKAFAKLSNFCPSMKRHPSVPAGFSTGVAIQGPPLTILLFVQRTGICCRLRFPHAPPAGPTKGRALLPQLSPVRASALHILQRS